MSKPRARGFTLIELLTVIAIIAILVGFTAAVLPKVMEKAKITKTESTFKQINTALVAYQTDNGTLPPGYGYWILEDPPRQNKAPYMNLIHFFREFNLYDENWADNYDTNRNGGIDGLEYQPVATNENTIYDGSTLSADQAAKMQNEVPPFAYFPVNRAQADKLRAFCEKDSNRQFASTNDVRQLLLNMSFPPPYYDDYVLISPGPAGNTFGIIPPNDTWIADTNFNDGRDDSYYINALRAFYLATRDYPSAPGQNGNGKPDFDFRARTRGGEKTFQLPDAKAPFGAGPLIFHSGG